MRTEYNQDVENFINNRISNVSLFLNNNENIRRKTERLAICSNKLKKAITSTLFSIFEDALDCQSDISDIREAECYRQGFNDALSIMKGI